MELGKVAPITEGNETSRPEKVNIQATEGAEKEEIIEEAADFDEEKKDGILIPTNE